MPLLDPEFLNRLEQLRIRARRAFPGTARGERRSTRRGASVEFADFRKYEAGDDFRHVDWNIYARLERLMLRQFVEEEDVRIDLLIDQSGSMHFGLPTKFELACRAAAALAFVAVASLDRVSAQTFDSAIRARTKALRGRGHLMTLLSFLANLSEADKWSDLSGASLPGRSPGAESVRSEAGVKVGATDLTSVLKQVRHQTSRPGILFIMSDFLDPRDFKTEMKLLVHKGFDVNLIQVLAQEELQPEAGRDFLVVDSETNETREITANHRTMLAYKTALSRFTDSLEQFSRLAGIGYVRVAGEGAFEDLLLKNLSESRMTE